MDYGEGKCLVFLHGWGGEIASFQSLADRLSARFRIITMDLYGFGATPHPSFPLTIEDYANGVRALLSERQARDVVLVGHSFGGRVAMRIAAKDKRVVGVVLIDSAGILPRRRLKYHLKVVAYKLAKKLGFKRLPQGSEDYKRLSGEIKKTFVNVVNESSENDARAIDVPTLLIWGKKDKDTPLYMCRRLRELIRESQSIEIEDAGHFSYLEHPELVYRVIRAFRERI